MTYKQKHNRVLAERGLRDAFAATRFASDDERDIMFDSYMINIDSLVAYACGRKISPYKYAMSIKNILAQELNDRNR